MDAAVSWVGLDGRFMMKNCAGTKSINSRGQDFHVEEDSIFQRGYRRAGVDCASKECQRLAR